MAIIAMTLMPLASGFFKEGKLLRSLYFQSVAEQVLDGEREVLMSGAWKKYPVGSYLLLMSNETVEQLPEKNIMLTVSDVEGKKRKFVLTWTPRKVTGMKEIRKEVIINVD